MTGKPYLYNDVRRLSSYLLLSFPGLNIHPVCSGGQLIKLFYSSLPYCKLYQFASGINHRS